METHFSYPPEFFFHTIFSYKLFIFHCTYMKLNEKNDSLSLRLYSESQMEVWYKKNFFLFWNKALPHTYTSLILINNVYSSKFLQMSGNQCCKYIWNIYLNIPFHNNARFIVNWDDYLIVIKRIFLNVKYFPEKSFLYSNYISNQPNIIYIYFFFIFRGKEREREY